MVLVRPNSYILPLCRLRKTARNGGRIVLYVCPALCSEKAEKHQSDEGKESQMSTAKGLHDGHRARVRQRFLTEGLRGFESHQILEMLLFYGIPRRDTNELAHRLINTFGSLSRVMEAEYEDLLKVPGMTAQAATLIQFCRQLSAEYIADRDEVGCLLDSTDKVGRFLLPRFLGRTKEAVMLMCFDGKCRLLNCSVIFEGSINTVDISIRLALQQALRWDAAAVIVAHNHPYGHALPSREDINTTLTLGRQLSVVDVQLLDHIIVADNDYISMRDSAEFAPIFHRVWTKENHYSMPDIPDTGR